MKRMTLAVIGLGTIIVLGYSVARLATPAANPTASSESIEVQADVEPAQTKTIEVHARQSMVEPVEKPHDTAVGIGEEMRSPAPVPVVPTIAANMNPGFNQAIDTLLSGQTTFKQKQAVWKQLKDEGKIDQAIGELEQRVAADQPSANSISALGQAYWQKCSLIKDIREQAILVMKADQAFDAALNIDPSNWDARYTKAIALSHWPAELNKGNEVIEQFRTLIQQQESQSPQPQYAKSYLRLGEQYEKTGHPDYAAQVWQRGLAFFPDSEDLIEKLTPSK